MAAKTRSSSKSSWISLYFSASHISDASHANHGAYLAHVRDARPCQRPNGQRIALAQRLPAFAGFCPKQLADQVVHVLCSGRRKKDVNPQQPRFAYQSGSPRCHLAESQVGINPDARVDEQPRRRARHSSPLSAHRSRYVSSSSSSSEGRSSSTTPESIHEREGIRRRYASPSRWQPGVSRALPHHHPPCLDQAFQRSPLGYPVALDHPPERPHCLDGVSPACERTASPSLLSSSSIRTFICTALPILTP